MKWLHNILKGASLTGALFVFQACYGIKQTYLDDQIRETPMSFSLVSESSGKPVGGIRILCSYWDNADSFYELGLTGEDGKCSVWLPYAKDIEGPRLRFEDVEGVYAVKDTSIYDLREREIVVKLKQMFK